MFHSLESPGIRGQEKWVPYQQTTPGCFLLTEGERSNDRSSWLCLKDEFHSEGSGQVTQSTELRQVLILLGCHEESDIWLSKRISDDNALAY